MLSFVFKEKDIMSKRYQLVKLLGRGGFGKIELVHDCETGRNVVRKSLINPTLDNCQRLIREGEICMQLAQEIHVVDLLDYSFNYPNPWLIFPYYQEGTLKRFVGNRNWYDSIQYVRHVATGLSAVHRIGGIHRDINPSNLFVDKTTDAKRFVRIGDFGFGRLPQPYTSGTMTVHPCGTPEYIAPELYLPNARFSAACDIYSLGITGIELITGSRKRESINTIWINNDVTALLLEMTSWTPNKRPSAATVAARTLSILQTYNANFNAVASIGLTSLAVYGLYKLFSK